MLLLGGCGERPRATAPMRFRGSWDERFLLCSPPGNYCGFFTPTMDPGNSPYSGPTGGLVSLKEAKGGAQSSAGALCMKNDRAFIHGVAHGVASRHWAPPALPCTAWRQDGWCRLLHAPGAAAAPCPTPRAMAHLVPQPQSPVSANPPVFVLMSSPSTYAKSYF